MNDHLDPDDLASAALDGDVDAAERARIAADPALQARVDALGEVRGLLGDTPGPSAAAREAAIAAALGEFDVLHAPAPVRRPPAPVISLASRRRFRWALSAAAAAVLVVGAALVLGRGGDDSDEAATEVSTAAQLAAPDDQSTGAQRAAGAADTAAPEAGAFEAPAVVADSDTLKATILRSGDDLVAYATAVAEAPPGAPVAEAPSATEAPAGTSAATERGNGCVLGASFTDVVAVGPAQYNGVQVDVFRAVDTSREGDPLVAVAIDSFTCIVVDSQPIP